MGKRPPSLWRHGYDVPVHEACPKCQSILLLVCVAASPSPKYTAHTFECLRCSFRFTARIECNFAFRFEDEAALMAHVRALAFEMDNFDLPSGTLFVSDESGAVLGKILIVRPPRKLN
jgi:hypothetical protein